MGLRGFLAFVDGTAAGVVTGEGGNDWDGGGEDGVVRRREQHAREARLDGDAGEFATDVGKACTVRRPAVRRAPVVADRAEFK